MKWIRNSCKIEPSVTAQSDLLPAYDFRSETFVLSKLLRISPGSDLKRARTDQAIITTLNTHPAPKPITISTNQINAL